MRIVSANLWCFNPSQLSAIQRLLDFAPDLIVLAELKPRLLKPAEHLFVKHGFTLVQAQTNQQMTLCVLSRTAVQSSEILAQGVFASRPQIRVQLSSGVIVFGIHTMAPITPWKYLQRNKQLEKLASLIRNEPNPVVAAGDFNIHSGETAFKRFLGSAGGSHGRATGSGNRTWPSILPLFGIDHIVCSQHFRINCFESGKFIWSDHLPVIANISLNNGLPP